MRELPLVLLAALAALGASGCSTTATAPTQVMGAWRVAQIRLDAPDGSSVITTPQNGLFIFTKSHYSAVWVPVQDRPAAAATPWAPTPSEMLTSYKSLVAHTGTYDIHSGVLVLHAEQAKNPNFVGGRITYNYRLADGSLMLTQTAIVYPGDKSDPRVRAQPQTLKLVRVEEL